MEPLQSPGNGRRVGIAALAAATLVAVAVLLPGGSGGTTTMAAAVEAAKSAAGVPHDDDLLPAHMHVHDPATKNLLARGLAESAQSVEPVSAAQRKAAASYVDHERALPDPKLVKVAAYPAHAAVPADRYAMAGACYTLQAGSRYVTRSGTALAVAAVPAEQAAPFYFKATRLGGYLLHTSAGEVTLAKDGSVAVAAKPSPQADWTVQKTAKGFTFAIGGTGLHVAGGQLSGGPATAFQLRHVTAGCAAYPEAGIDIAGNPFAGKTPFQEVRGFVDGHTHGMAFEFLGGDLHCGHPWDAYGAPYALPDCAANPAAGAGTAAVEGVLSGKARMDSVGWPTFKDWPAPDALAHEGTYWRWLERAWRGGQRLFVNLLVENNKLCQVYPVKHNSCDDMDSIRLQARDMHKMQDYIDAQFGGPGKGFYRIVTDPFQARKVINAGKMAVVMGIETSIPFGCTFKAVLGKDQPACNVAEIDANLDEMRRMGVRQMELVNKFDNALAGVAGDAGETGLVVNGANFMETGTFWAMQHCDPPDGESADNPQAALPDIGGASQDALFGAVGQLFGGPLPAVPLYGPPAHCNKRGLTTLGEHTIRGLAQRRMIFDPDHMSVKARNASMDLIESMRYPGVISSHSWSTPDTYPRVYRAGGFITPYAGDSTGFVDKWQRHLGWADPRYYFGFGFGADINGLGAQGSPRGAGVPNPVRYPFTGLGGVTVGKQTAGKRVWDINVDGVAQYGLYPDWVEDLRKVADARRKGDGAKIVDDMARGAEAYLQMWERAVGLKPDSCRNPGLRKRVGKVRHLLHKGMTTRQVMKKVGQPYQRLGASYRFCAKTSTRKRVVVRVAFSRGGKVRKVTFR